MRLGSFLFLILAGALLLGMPATAQTARGERLITPPQPERLLFLDVPQGVRSIPSMPTMAPERHRGLEEGGERRFRDEVGRFDGDFRSSRGRSLSLGTFTGTRQPVAFDRYVAQLENRIRSARRQLDG